MLKQRLRNLSIRLQIRYAFLLFFVILLVCVLVVIRTVYRSQSTDRLLEARAYEDNLIAQQVESILVNANSCSNSTIINLNSALGDGDGRIAYPNLYSTRDKRRVQTVFENGLLIFPEARQIAVLLDNGDAYVRGRDGRFSATDGNQALTEGLRQMGIPSRGAWLYELALPGSPSPQGLFFVKTLRDLALRDLGYVVLEVSAQRLEDAFNRSSFDAVELYLLDDSGVAVSSNNPDVAVRAMSGSLSALIEARADANRYQVRETPVDDGWRLLSVLDMRANQDLVNAMTWNAALVALLVSVAFYWAFRLIADQIARPLTDLSAHMRKFEQSPPEALSLPRSGGEVGALIASFNHMAEVNQSLFDRLSQEKQVQRHLELALLQAQIKPHFLYNTLDTIYCLAAMGRGPEAGRVTKLLAGYYRLVLNQGGEWISLQQELSATEKYLEIQSTRYSDVLSYEIRVPSYLYALELPKLTLQPLVENAIYHGIKPKGLPGHILITGAVEGGQTYLRVSDDGAGMTPEQFEAALSDDLGAPHGESFGLSNVLQRLKLFYGDASSMILERGGNGTTIAICIDYTAEEGEHVPDSAGG